MPRAQTLQDFSRICGETDDVARLWQRTLSYFHGRTIGMVSYHSQNVLGKEAFVIRSDGFPREWACDYARRNLVTIDPVPQLARVLARPFWWTEIERLTELTPEQRRYLQEAEAAGLCQGLAIPVFGPDMRNACVGLGFDTREPGLQPQDVFELHCGAQIAHMRYCALTARQAERQVDLSPREREVLSWIARGKSNSVIAEILGISGHTVDTLIRRLFEKLKVNDRTTAAILAVGNGLVHVGRR